MERARPYLKAAAVVSAVLLGGAFVAYRAGAFAASAPVETQAEQQQITGPSATTESPHKFMLGSKSAPAFTPPSSGTSEPPKPLAPLTGLVPPSVLMGGSKSIQLFPASRLGLEPGAPPVPVMPPPAPLPPDASKP
jgi:hypothetical protein